MKQSEGPWINFSLAPGKYYYAVLANGSYAANGGSFVNNGSVPTINVTFSNVTEYPVTFTARGLANSATGLSALWDVWISPFCLAGCNLTTGPITMMVPNGTYEYFPNSSNPGLGAEGGLFTVEGGPVSVSVPFGYTYPVTFTESGLPAVVNWFVNLTDEPPWNATGTTITQNLPNGSYSYAIASSNQSWEASAATASGSFTVSGAAVLESVDFHLVTYTVTWTLSGSPPTSVTKALAKYGWTAELGGTVEHVTGSSASFTVPNGTYEYLLTGPGGVVMGEPGAPASGSLTVDGANWAGLTVDAKGATATLKLTEKGLTAGQAWCVEVSGREACSTSSNVKYMNLTPSNYYTSPLPVSVVSPLSGQNITAKIGKTPFAVPGWITLYQSTTVALTFAYRSNVTFTESGLTSGIWSVTIKGHTETNGSGEPIVFNETNGTYGYKVGAVSGYTSVGSPTKAVVNGAAVTVTVTFTESGLTGGSVTVTKPYGDPIVYKVGAISGYTNSGSPKSGTPVLPLVVPLGLTAAFLGLGRKRPTK